jgi:hypothetical protein
VPVRSFAVNDSVAPGSAYHSLPTPANGWIRNRFAGGYLLYGSEVEHGGYRPARSASLFAFPYAMEGGEIRTIRIEHSLENIAPMGAQALVIGDYRHGLQMSTIALGAVPSVAHHYVRRHTSGGRLRYGEWRAEPAGLIGLRSWEGPDQALAGDPPSVLFLSNDALHLAEIGELAPRPDQARPDGCRVEPCEDWYSNADAVFVDDRIFALLGYELIEGKWVNGRLAESRRIDFAPAPASPAR